MCSLYHSLCMIINFLPFPDISLVYPPIFLYIVVSKEYIRDEVRRRTSV